MADLVGHAVQLLERLRLGLGRHPAEAVDVVFHRRLDLLHHAQRAGARVGGEVLRDVDLAERLAQVAIDAVDAALPARLQLLRAGERLAEELEVGVDERRAQVRRRQPRGVPPQVGLPVVSGTLVSCRSSAEK